LSLLPIASLLCALENEGYGRLVLLPRGEADEPPSSSSGTGSDVLLLVVVGEGLVERRSGGVTALSALRAREDLWRGLSFDLVGVSGSFSFSLSRGFAEGMMGKDWECWCETLEEDDEIGVARVEGC
jgi:hypothetical protein